MEEPGGSDPSPPLFLDQIEARRAEIFFLRAAPPYLRVWIPPLSSPPPEGLDPSLVLQRGWRVSFSFLIYLQCQFNEPNQRFVFHSHSDDQYINTIDSLETNLLRPNEWLNTNE